MWAGHFCVGLRFIWDEMWREDEEDEEQDEEDEGMYDELDEYFQRVL